jgi:hypothetical protein
MVAAAPATCVSHPPTHQLACSSSLSLLNPPTLLPPIAQTLHSAPILTPNRPKILHPRILVQSHGCRPLSPSPHIKSRRPLRGVKNGAQETKYSQLDVEHEYGWEGAWTWVGVDVEEMVGTAEGEYEC